MALEEMNCKCKWCGATNKKKRNQIVVVCGQCNKKTFYAIPPGAQL